MRQRLQPVVITLMLFLTVRAALAREYAPRVVSPERADAYSMKTFAAFPRWRDLKDDALAWEVYKYLVDTKSGLFHCNEVLEGDEALAEYRNVRDPVKIINVYGYAYCGILGAREAAPNALRHIRKKKGDVVVASLIENPFFGSATLFVQLLPIEYGEQKPRDKRRAELEQYLFDGRVPFQRQLQGCFGASKPRVEGMSASEAEDAFLGTL